MRTSERTFSRISPSRILWAPWKFVYELKKFEWKNFLGPYEKIIQDS